MSWSPKNAIRSRREALGLTQSDLAKRLGVTKSLLSHIEAGKRQPTEKQVATLSEVLGIPPDLLVFGWGRLPADIRGVLAANATEVVAAIRQRTEAQAVSYPTAPSSVMNSRRPQWTAMWPSRGRSCPRNGATISRFTPWRS
jgi:transcriptional regulator with XRE-family HTH domain